MIRLFEDELYQSYFLFDSHNLSRCFEIVLQNGSKQALTFLLEQIFTNVLMFSGGEDELTEVVYKVINRSLVFRRKKDFMLILLN